MDQTDIHFHILPGVDDGPPGLDEALELARLAAAEGTETVVATPHVRADYLTDVVELPGLVHDLQHEIRRAGIDLTVDCGAELGHDMGGQAVPDGARRDRAGPAAGPLAARGDAVRGLGGSFLGALDELHDRGFGVVLAHPERCAGLLERHRSTLDRELSLGVQLQVNALSFHGAHGEAAQVAPTGCWPRAW